MSADLNALCSAVIEQASVAGILKRSQCFVLILPRLRKAWVGLGIAHKITYGSGAFTHHFADGSQSQQQSDDPFEDLEQVLGKDVDYYFMLSLDLHRPQANCKLPTMVWVQPEIEIQIDLDSKQCFSQTTDTGAGTELVDRLNAAHRSGEIPAIKADVSAVSTRWQTEDDAVFLQRLAKAVDALQEVDGKVIVTRRYQASAGAGLDPLRLFQIYNFLEPDCAASHYFRLGDSCCSIGCTPENIFTLDGDQLAFDVIASTRGISSDPEEDARWEKELVSDGKELKEHDMALGRYRARLESLCEPGSIVMDHYHDIRRFRYVRHLFSHLYGKLKPEQGFFDLLRGSSPALSTYPDELIPVADDGVTPTRFYGGVVGRVANNFRKADVYLNLRSVLIEGDQMTTMGGVGVVRESRPELELIEVRNKLRCLMEAEATWRNE